MDKRTIDTYDQYAKLYDEEVIEFWDNFPAEILDKFVESLPGKRILNLGSGSGRDALLLRDRGLEVVCIDASKSMIAMTESMGLESHLADFAHLDFPNDSFDGVWAYTSLIHVTQDEAAATLRRVRELLRLEGRLLFGAIEGDTAGMVERKTMPGSLRYFKKYGREELRSLVESAGFQFAYEHDYRPHNNTYLNQLFTVTK